ncbi:MAG TPA: hypothetical protein DHU69_06495 [Deltaproteobacteria bacterium]|nr:hypothetical protein [Deltaproteobacteria bacterium]
MKKLIPYIFLFAVMMFSANAEYCFQEFANVSNSCGGLGNGTYFSNGEGSIDGNYSSSSSENNGFYVNYSKPLNLISNNSLLQSKHQVNLGGGTNQVNFSIPLSCQNSSLDKLVLKGNRTGCPGFCGTSNAQYLCNDGKDFISISSFGIGDFGTSFLLYEESIWWNTTSIYLNNVSISPQPLISGNAKGHCNYTSETNLPPIDNQTLWYQNNSIVNTANNSFILLGGNVSENSNITFSCRYNDTYDWSSWVNSSTLTVGDQSPPTINGNRTASPSVVVNSVMDTYCNVSDSSGVVSSVTIEVENPNQQKTNLSASLDSGSSSNGEWKASYTTSVVGTHAVRCYAQDGSGNRANTGNELTFTATTASTPPQGGGGGGGTTTIIQNGNQTPILYFGTLSFSFTIYSTPSSQERYLKFENKGNGAITNGNVVVLGNASKYISAKVCETPEVNCKSSGIVIKSGATGFLLMQGNFDRNLIETSQGIVRISEEGNNGKTFDLLISLDRPLIYGVISKISNSTPYMEMFGDNELPALVITYLGFVILVLFLFFIVSNVL